MRQTILLADDSPTIRRLVGQTFEDGDFEVVSVSNGEAAIKTFEEVHPSVVLADIYMPGKNGYEVCTHIRNHPALGQTPVILLVGAFDAFDEEVAKQAGATANITKPFEPGALIDLVVSVLAGQASESELLPQLESEPESVVEPRSESATVKPDDSDLLGLVAIFKDETASEPAPGGPFLLTEEYIDRIADRVLQKLAPQVIENIAWDIVPDLAEKIVREELKRIGSGLAVTKKNES